MDRTERIVQARRSLDRRMSDLGPAERWEVPRSGWVRAIRDALGMTAQELGRRLGVTQPAVFALEKSELGGGVRLDTLRRAAEAMDCTLVYAFVPDRSLEATVRTRAESIADEELRRVGQTMALEDQAVRFTPEARETLIRSIIDSRGLWSRR